MLICPTGLQQLRRPLPGVSQAVYGLFSLPALGKSVYNGIASYNYIESYLRENLYVDPTRVTPALVEHYYQSAHQPGAQYALRSFLAGLLDCDLTAVYPQVTQPILICWGRYARQSPVENAQAFVEQGQHARLRIFEHSGMLPHDEEADDFNHTAINFFSATEGAALPETPPITAVGASAE